ncbi:PREDICTED: uncharacterized protein At4g26485-like [Erythranthe guttata]|uniref:uncharacterized protein At4g26485-like n=1 Tax=Erythranthe guttata TaxID=4155 RepID=UPI00064D7D17|nr:PREDICTED: uncharacterized protein At4g26485-like [Erythranthe guttata]|eukprot:XP_012848375.1 PREDICTED: uncharacterized protein At4g26485-like [Erythranthe guttata]
MEEKWINHYSSRHQMLLVGEGDFSFAASLATAFGNASNIVATSLDSQVMLLRKYPTEAANVCLLKDKGCTVIHGFTRNEQDSYQISLHKEVVRGFLRNGREMLTRRGEIHVTHKTSYPFTEWGIEELGREVGLVLTEKAAFSISDYPGYENKRGGEGSSCRSSDTFPARLSTTFKFAK